MAVLYVVATPIGNLDDITLRALRTLGEVDLIYAEDTRHTKKLLEHHGISLDGRTIVSCFEHNESGRVSQLLKHLNSGRQVALVSDAGTPTISDPGYSLVRATWEGGYSVVPIPGACAAVAALSASGLPTDRFTFAGFPPKKSSARRRWLDELSTAPGTLVLYAAARDVGDILNDLSELRGNPEVVIFREITKRYEECLRGKARELGPRWAAEPRKGEVTLMAGRGPERDFDDAALLELLRQEGVKEVAQNTGVSKRRLYQLSLILKEQDSS
jgi:16S rRNA (cytidine1402-2'-O)-methyltransferase